MKSPVEILQNLQSELSFLSSDQHETANSDPNALNKLTATVRANAYDNAFDLVQKAITAIEDQQFAELMNNVNTWKRSTRLTQDTVNAMTRKTQMA